MNQLLQNEMDILTCFFPKLSSLTSKEIEEKSGYSHERVFTILKNLVKKKYLVEKKIGKTNVFDLIRDRDVMYQVFVSYETARRLKFKEKHPLLYKRLYEFLHEISPEGPAVVFGSYAKGTQTEKSDVDILCVSAKGDVTNAVRVFRTKYNINIQAVTLDISDFRNIKKENPIFWNDLIEYGIVLDGLDLFFKEAYL